jgi:hypothetical protein
MMNNGWNKDRENNIWESWNLIKMREENLNKKWWTMDEMKDTENKIWESWNATKDEGRNESDKL